MSAPKTATGVIHYREDGEDRTWLIGCMAHETAEDLKLHLAKWRPRAEFVSAEIKPD